MNFEKNPMFYDSYNNTKRTNLINSSYKTNDYLVGQASTTAPYCLNTGSYNSYIVLIKASQEYYINKGSKLTLYDKDLKYINNSYIDSAYTDYTFTTLFDGYAVISHNTTNVIMYEGDSGSNSAYTETLPDYVLLKDVLNLGDLIDSTNVLYGKKYVALDVHLHMVFSNSPTADYTIESGTYTGEYKVYLFLINNRNLMKVVNLAIIGMSLININRASQNYLSNIFLNQYQMMLIILQ